MNEASGATKYPVREAVGLLPSPDALEAAVEALEKEGFGRTAISVLASDHAVKDRLGQLYSSAQAAADDPKAPRTAFPERESRREGAAALVGGPGLVGGFAGAFAAAASGGALATAIATAVAGGVVGAGLGALLLVAVARHHAEHVEKQLAQGGLLLWVTTPDAAAEKRALAVLERHGASNVHIHEFEREWGVQDVPLHDVQPDPFLDKEPKG